jgi:hypothetical protein
VISTRKAVQGLPKTAKRALVRALEACFVRGYDKGLNDAGGLLLRLYTQKRILKFRRPK